MGKNGRSLGQGLSIVRGFRASGRPWSIVRQVAETRNPKLGWIEREVLLQEGNCYW